MSDHFKAKLGAYLDGELGQSANHAMENHLAACPACQAELDELHRISQLLQDAPLPEFTAALDYRAQLILKLPRRVSTPFDAPNTVSSSPAQPGFLAWMFPLLVLAGWIFIQTTFGVSSLVTLAGQTGLLGNAAAWASPVHEETAWFAVSRSALGNLLSPQSQAGLGLLNDTSLVIQNLVTVMLFQAIAALLFWAALIAGWHNRVKELLFSFNEE